MIRQLMDHKPIKKKQTLRQNFMFLQEVWINMCFLRAESGIYGQGDSKYFFIFHLKNNVLVF